MAILTPAQVTLAGTLINYVAAGGSGDSFLNDGNTGFRVKNGGASPITVTVNSQTPCSQGFDHDITVTVAAAAEREIGPFPKSRFDDVNGRVNITYSAVTSVTVVPVKHD